MEFERHRFEPDTVNTKKIYPVILISILAHCLLGWLLYHYSMSPKVHTPEQDYQAIQAQLIFVETPKTVEKSISKDLSTSQQKVEESVPETTEEPVAETTEEPAFVEALIEQPSIEEADKRESLPAIDMPNIADSNAAQTDVQPLALSSREMARKHLQENQQQTNQQFAQQQASEYRRQLTSPDLNPPDFDAFTTEDEKTAKALSVRVDCSTGLNKTIALLSSIASGGVGGLRCSERADLQPYIDKHVKKPLAQP